MKMKIPYIILLLLLSLSGISQKKNLDLYLLIGQSNMAGRGKVEAQDSCIHPRVLSLSKDMKWIPAQDPIHFDKKVAGVGLGRTFGIEMAESNPEITIGLIPCAVGGSPVSTWQPGGYHRQTKTHPWDDMEKRLEFALQSGKLQGILWLQGESDSHPDLCHQYKEALKNLIQRCRGLGGNDVIPFIAGEFGSFKFKKSKKMYPDIDPTPAEIVRASTIELIQSDPHAAFVSSHGLKHKGDGAHFNAKGYRILGQRYAKAMKKLQKKYAK